MSQHEPEQTQEQVVADLAAKISHASFGTGPLAELRRMDPRRRAPGDPVLHRLLARFVPDKWLSDDGMMRWALLVHLLALAAPDQHRGDEPLGKALFAAGYSEGRLTRLLEAREEELPIVLPRMVRFLVAKGERLNPFELARLVIWRATEKDRLRIARDYYRSEAKAPETA